MKTSKSGLNALFVVCVSFGVIIRTGQSVNFGRLVRALEFEPSERVILWAGFEPEWV